jgi:ribosome maturation factor RimP
MRRSYRTIVAAAAFFPALTIATPTFAQAAGKAHAVVGTLQKVDGQRITVQTKAGSEVMTLVSQSQIHQGAATVQGRNLSSFVGQKIKVRYVDANGQKQVQTVIVSTSSKTSSSLAAKPVNRPAGEQPDR